MKKKVIQLYGLNSKWKTLEAAEYQIVSICIEYVTFFFFLFT